MEAPGTGTRAETPPPAPMGRAALLVRALRSRNYRLFFVGQGISLIGTWMQQLAVAWLVYRLTGSAFILGTLGLVSQVPTLLFTPVAGVLADRWNLRRTLVLTQTAACVQALLLAGLTLSGLIAVWHIFALSVVLGIINAFDMPTRQAFVPQMIERPEDLQNAIALNSSLMNASRLVGPALAGLLIEALGEGLCFLFNGLTYVAVIAALLAMRLPPRPHPVRATSVGRGLWEGCVYAFGFAPIRTLLLLLALSSLMGMSYGTLMPVFVRDVLAARADAFGFLMGATGLGALAGALYLASRPTVLGLGRLIALGASLFGFCLVGLSLVRHLLPALILMVFVGLGMMLQIASTNTMLQTIVDDDKRGRVMSLYTLAFLGMTPLGSMIAGSLAQRCGAPLAIMVGGACCAAGGLLFALRLPRLRPLIRPIYIRKGILPARDGVAVPPR